MYYKVNEQEAKIVKHISDLYVRGFYCDEIATIFNKGDIVYGIYERMIKLFRIIEDIIYGGASNKTKKEELIFIYELIDDIDYTEVLKRRDKDEIESIVIKNLENCVTKIQSIKRAKAKLETIMEYYNFLIREIKKLYTEQLEIIEEKPKNKKYGALFGYDLVM